MYLVLYKDMDNILELRHCISIQEAMRAQEALGGYIVKQVELEERKD